MSGRRPSPAMVLAVLLVVLLVVALILKSSGEQDQASVEAAVVSAKIPDRRNDSLRLTGARAEAKARSMLNLKEDEVAIIRLPELDLATEFEVDPGVIDEGRPAAYVVAEYSPEQLLPMITSILVRGHDLDVRIAEGADCDFFAFGVESVEIVQEGRSTWSKVTIQDSKTGTRILRVSRISRGNSRLFKNPRGSGSAGFLVVTGAEEEVSE